jgi:hypothetical protein
LAAVIFLGDLSILNSLRFCPTPFIAFENVSGPEATKSLNWAFASFFSASFKDTPC